MSNESPPGTGRRWYLDWEARGDAADAGRTLRACLGLMRAIHDALWLAFAPEGLAGAAVLEGHGHRALGLAGAAEARRAALGDGAFWPMLGRLVEQWLAPARAALAAGAAEAAWSEGWALSFDQAADYALGGEDMAYFLQRVPGCFFRLGTGNKACGLTYGNHHPRFDVDETALPLGAAALAGTALRFLGSR